METCETMTQISLSSLKLYSDSLLQQCKANSISRITQDIASELLKPGKEL
jgi:hypothetical protein